MCDLNAYIRSGEAEELFFENVDSMQLDGNTILLKNLFGEQKTIEGVIREVSLRRHRVLIEPKA